MIADLQALHFLRPDWLWALLAVPLLVWAWRARQHRDSPWKGAVDPHLLPALLAGGGARSTWLAPAIGTLGFVLAVLALAGPSWRQVEQPLWQTRTPLVIALDLSTTSLAGDLPPTRLAQARAKLATLLAEREGGQVGLVAYAGDAFTVAPVTADAANVALFLDALHPRVMPVDGQRGDRAIAWSAQLLRQAGFERGHILLLTDHADAEARQAAAAALAQGYRVSALGLGSAQGAPYRQPGGGFATARLDADSLRQLAAAGGGSYATISADEGDLARLGVLDATADGTGGLQGETGRSWQDEGFWLLPPLMLLALLAFRRGAPVLIVVLALWLPLMPAGAAELWQRADQIAHERMQAAAQAYRGGEFEKAAGLYADVDGADADYNRGNALAKAGHYPQAIEAYEEALRQQPAMEDAVANKRAVEAAMERQRSQGQQPGKQQQPGEPGDGQGSDASPGQQQPADAAGDPDNAGSADKASPPGPEEPPPDTASGPGEQEAADQAQRQRMQQALEQAGEGAPEPAAGPATQETAEERERRLANEAWLRRVPDDPGGLLREKFRLEYERRRMQDVWEPR
jgi:Ca-activated chloride channel family protein